MTYDDKIPPSGKSYTCNKIDCFHCYEMNRDKSERNLIMPKIKPSIFKSVRVYKVPKRSLGNGTPRNLLLDPESGKEMFLEEAAMITGYTYKHVADMTSGRDLNFTGLIRVA